MATDLTFNQVQAYSPSGSFIVSNGKVLIDVSALTGDSHASLDDTGFCEVMAKLCANAQQAQTTANLSVSSPNRLSAFATTNGIPVLQDDGTYLVTSTYTVTVRYPINTNAPIGATS